MWQRGSRLVTWHALEIVGAGFIKLYPCATLMAPMQWGGAMKENGKRLAAHRDPPTVLFTKKASTSKTPVPIPQHCTVSSV